MSKNLKNTPPQVKTTATVRKLMAEIRRRYPDAEAWNYIFERALGVDDFDPSKVRSPADLTSEQIEFACAELQEKVECGPALPGENVVNFRDPGTPSPGSEDTDDDAEDDDAVMQLVRMEGFSKSVNVTPLEALDPEEDVRNIKQLCSRWVWCIGTKRFIDRCDPSKQWDVAQFDSAYNRILAQGPSISKVLFKYPRMAQFDAMTFTPGALEFNGRSYNTWRPSKVIAAKGDTRLWDAHLLWLFPDDATRNLVLNWLAWVYQNQDKKPMHALLLVGETFGTGKSYIARVLEHLVGLQNTQRPKNSSLNGDFNAWAAQAKLILIEELMQVGKKDVEGTLRDIITEPVIEVNIKNISAFKVPSYSAMLGVSNHTDALALLPGDRRWAIAETLVTIADKLAKINAGYFAKLMPMVDNDNPDLRALGAIAYQLKHRKLGSYTALGEAPITDAKATMIDYNKKPLIAWLDSERENDPFTRRVVNIEADIIPLIPQHVMREQSSRNPTVQIAKWLKKELGATIGVKAKIAGRSIRLWAINGTAARWPDEVAAMYRADRTGKSPVAANDDEAMYDFMEPAS